MKDKMLTATVVTVFFVAALATPLVTLGFGPSESTSGTPSQNGDDSSKEDAGEINTDDTESLSVDRGVLRVGGNESIVTNIGLESQVNSDKNFADAQIVSSEGENTSSGGVKASTNDTKKDKGNVEINVSGSSINVNEVLNSGVEVRLND